MKAIVKIVMWVMAALVVSSLAALLWLRWDAGRSLQPWFEQRHGPISDVRVLSTDSNERQTSELKALTSASGLSVSFRVIKPSQGINLPVLLVLGGHRTGSDAAQLFGDVGQRAVIALDYPYHGPEKVRGVMQTLRTVPLARQAFRDTPPAVTLVMDWLLRQAWVDREQIVIIGASLGVPFAAHAVANDSRIGGAILVHGAADNQVWLEKQVARRTDNRLAHKPLATLIHWLAYAPTFATQDNVARISPRPVLIVGARNDERTPVEQIELLYESAGEPKWLRWTEGAHIQPGRAEIVADLLQIADEMLPFPRQAPTAQP